MLYQTLRLRQNAYHEAGHVVMARLVGISLNGVSITERDGTTELSDTELERQNYALETRERIKETMMPLIQVLTAGCSAEKIFSEKNRSPETAEDDKKAAERYLEAMAQTLPDDYIPEWATICNNTRQILAEKKQREQIRRLAHILFKRRALAEKEIEETLH